MSTPVAALAHFLMSFAGCMGWLLLVERSPRLRRLLTRKKDREREAELSQKAVKYLGEERLQRINFAITLVVSLVLALCWTVLVMSISELTT